MSDDVRKAAQALLDAGGLGGFTVLEWVRVVA